MHRFERDELKATTGSLHAQRIIVGFQHVDAAGIVFYARFFEFFHEAYEGLLRRLGSPLEKVLAEGRWAAPLRHASADYLAPLTLGEAFDVHVALARVEETEITLGYRVTRADGGIVAVGQTVHAFIDPKVRRRVSVPSELAEFLRGG